MIKYDPNKPLISIHIPKSGGQSFKKCLKKWFKPNFYTHYPKGGKPSEIPIYPTALHGSPVANMCIHGHFNSERGVGVRAQYPDVNQYITLLRDPLEMRISLFFYRQRQFQKGRIFMNGKRVEEIETDLDRFLSAGKSHAFLHFPEKIMPGNFKNVIDKYFIHIGILENIQWSVDIMAEKLNKQRIKITHRNSSSRNRQPSASVVEEFKKANHLEYAVYEYVKKLNS